jgi:hypothetical protein
MLRTNPLVTHPSVTHPGCYCLSHASVTHPHSLQVAAEFNADKDAPGGQGGGDGGAADGDPAMAMFGGDMSLMAGGAPAPVAGAAR